VCGLMSFDNITLYSVFSIKLSVLSQTEKIKVKASVIVCHGEEITRDFSLIYSLCSSG